jgi:hypothetical protein
LRPIQKRVRAINNARPRPILAGAVAPSSFFLLSPLNEEAMSDLSSTSGQAALKERPGANPNVLLPVLWLAAAVAIGLPSIRGGVFDAMSTDDAMRLV